MALEKARQRINDEYKSKKNVTDTSAISEVRSYVHYLLQNLHKFYLL